MHHALANAVADQWSPLADPVVGGHFPNSGSVGRNSGRLPRRPLPGPIAIVIAATYRWGDLHLLRSLRARPDASRSCDSRNSAATSSRADSVTCCSICAVAPGVPSVPPQAAGAGRNHSAQSARPMPRARHAVFRADRGVPMRYRLRDDWLVEELVERLLDVAHRCPRRNSRRRRLERVRARAPLLCRRSRSRSQAPTRCHPWALQLERAGRRLHPDR